MPKQRPRPVWQEVRRLVWERDGGMCPYPSGKHPVPLHEAHIDHVVSGKRGINQLSDLRTLCPLHHVLRADGRHLVAGLILVQLHV